MGLGGTVFSGVEGKSLQFKGALSSCVDGYLHQNLKNKTTATKQNKTVEVSFAMQHVTWDFIYTRLRQEYLPRTKLVLLSPLSKTKYSDAHTLSELSSTDNLHLLSAHKGDVTRHHSLQCWNNVVTIRNNVSTKLQRCVALKVAFANRLMPNITFKSIFRDFGATLNRLV